MVERIQSVIDELRRLQREAELDGDFYLHGQIDANLLDDLIEALEDIVLEIEIGKLPAEK